MNLPVTSKPSHNGIQHPVSREYNPPVDQNDRKLSQEHIKQMSQALAHEIRNPLTNINLSIGLLEPLLPDNSMQAYLDIIKRNTIRINALLNNFLNSQKTGGVIGTHSLSGLLDEALLILGDRIHLKNIRVHKHYSVPDIEVKVNGPEILLALTNIILNAVDAMRPNEGELTLFTLILENQFSIQIEDNGCGMGSDELDKIFDTYYTTKAGGIGVGLSTTQDILYSNQVGIKVESEIGEGTIFTLTFRDHQD